MPLTFRSIRWQQKVRVLYYLVQEKSINSVKSFMGPIAFYDRVRIVSAITSRKHGILHYAVYQGSLNIVEYLIVECGANVNVVYKTALVSLTPIFIAIAKRDFLMVRLLVKLGANLLWKNKYGENALMYACKLTAIYHSAFLYRIGAPIKGDRNVQLCARTLNYCLMALIFGTHANDIDSKGDSIFIIAAQIGNVAVMNTLRRFYVNVHYRNKFGYDALSAAIWKNQRLSFNFFVKSTVYSKIHVASAFEICGARMILYEGEYDKSLAMWVKSIRLRMSVPNGMRAKLKYYYRNQIKPIEEFQAIADIERIRGDPRACRDQAQLVSARILRRMN